MLKKIISVAFLLTLICSYALAHTAIIENEGENRYKAVRLTPEIYNNANCDLSDILIKDEHGENVPYFINSGNQTKYATDRPTYPMILINSYTKDNYFYFDYKVKNIPNMDIAATSIEMTTMSTGFAKNIEIYGSYDNINWEFVQRDALYSIDGKSKLDIEFTKTQKYTHYRFKLGNNLEKISFSSVTLICNYFTREKIYFVESITPDFSVEEKDKITYINIKGLKNLRLGEVIIDTDSMFKRNVSTPFLTSKELYNLSFKDAEYTDTAIPFNWRISKDDILVLKINNGDDKPINIKGIIVRYYADELVFEGGKSKKYAIHFGADGAKIAPVYDIERYKNEILKGKIDRLDIILDKTTKGPEQYNYKMIFNVVVVIVAAVLGLLILTRLRK